jgi:2,3-bisphosphoglycerate-independent phosphoglycerate mutase
MSLAMPDVLALPDGGRIVLAVLDGLGGLPDAGTGRTELEAAHTPNLDRLAARGALGQHNPVAPGVTPGSGPGHLALFGYDPLVYGIGRGVLSALGVGFELELGDVAVRLNFATLDADGRVLDRRAGRPTDAENRRLIDKLRAGVRPPAGIHVFFEPEKEHRACLILRGPGLEAGLSDTDPQEIGVPPLPVEAATPAAEPAARALQAVLDAAFAVLADEPVANAVLARGIDAYHALPTIGERFHLTGRAYARYPMYRGVARLVGMTAHSPQATDEDSARAVAAHAADASFHFVHFKAPDSRGEDGDYAAKVAAIEAIDALLPILEQAVPDVLIVTGDHSTPSQMRTHSWHPVPLLVVSPFSRATGGHTAPGGFGERACRHGELGTIAGKDIMPLALAHAGRLQKYGA